MASNPPGPCCATGFKHEGNPVGEIKNVNGVETYIVYPQDKNTEKVIVFLSDIFGIYINAQLLADEFAANGYTCVIPDLFRGDAIKLSDMESGKANLPAWLPNHQPSHVDPVVESTVKYVREELGAKRVAAVGYCFGAKYVCRHMKEGKIDVGFNAHPSFVTHEELGAITGPLSIAASEIDTIFTTQLRHESEETLKKTGQHWQINLFSGVSHGFAVRADLSNKHFKFAKEQAFCQAVNWFRQYL
ncbi:dienelactone hydrolase family protein [Aspergillus nomiae NRRL 13137]|uniref:Dienelactone hydrolase family protein n=1 Tax=Aspergillus nomiae NRRL (strain ATCC 15546 / NRRL 13137 / CBS 260.88 / M93) TaxID=1509407 RepID=A0A0L1IWQ2_ASPN3|nr:dienelactone hydrolase family protein [Aspergillus nomiae NRRL 13137]KNG83966.1 dienelactone hydrolase family protein [Aspergillus nomiae NRRL 13137]